MPHILTPEGKKQLEEKLNFYKTVKRVEVSKKIGAAREFGDLSENSEYDAAKEEQAQIEGEICEMEDILLTCEVVDDTKISKNEVSIGSTVKLYDEEFDEEVEYKILGSTESNPSKGIISNISPVGSALMGHKKGDKINIKINGETIVYKILNIK